MTTNANELSGTVPTQEQAPIWDTAPDKLDPKGRLSRICVIPHCERLRIAQRLCSTHYQAIRRGAINPVTGMTPREEKRAAHSDQESEIDIKLPFGHGELRDYVYIARTQVLVNAKTGKAISRNAAIASWGRWIARYITDGQVEQYMDEVWSPDPNFNAKGDFNSYQAPSGLVPDESFNDPLHEHLVTLLKNLAGPDPRDYEYFLNWLAYKFQNPHRVPCALILHGAQGSGKGTLTRLLKEIFDPCFSKITGGALEGDFTGWLYKRLMIVANEVNVSTNKDRHNTRKRLKDYTAPDTIDIHMKYAEHFNVQNHSAWIICSNDKYVVDIEDDDRRYSVLHSTSRLSDDLGKELSELQPEYYAKNLFNALYKRDIAGFKAYLPHENTARQAMKAKFRNAYVKIDMPPVSEQ